MTDREKITTIVEAVCDRYRETDMSLYIYDSNMKIMFTDEGEIRTVIRGNRSYGPGGLRSVRPRGSTEDKSL